MAKNLGYELRCVDPIPFDIEYTRDLGFYAAKFLEDGGTGAVVTIELDHCKPIPLSEMLDPKTHKMAMRPVDAKSERYRVARQYMVRLNKNDFERSPCARAHRRGGEDEPRRVPGALRVRGPERPRAHQADRVGSSGRPTADAFAQRQYEKARESFARELSLAPGLKPALAYRSVMLNTPNTH